jgi:LacI family transcriptional regulator
MIPAKSTISDVAKHAGVSTATVSRVLNGGICSDNTKMRVLKAVKSLGYNINLDGKALRSGKTKRIFLSLANISNPFYTTLAESIEASLSLSGYHILLSASADTEDAIHEQIDKAATGIADGFIFGPIEYSKSTVGKLKELSIPTVILGPPVSGTRLDSVGTSEYHGLKEAIIYLKSRNKKRFLLFNGPSNSIPGRNRDMYFAKVFTSLSDSSISFSIYNASAFTYEQAHIELKRFELLKNFDAIICGNDLMAAAALNLLQDSRVKIPEQVAVVGIDNDNFCNYLSPRLSSIDLMVPGMGEVAAQFLLDRLKQPDKAVSKHVSKSKFVPRQTT